MSFVQAPSLQILADSMGVPKLSDEAAKALAPDVEYRMRDVIQEAGKFQRHAKRSRLTTDDVSQALRMRNATPVYGFATTSRDADKGDARFLRVAGHSDLFFLEDPEVSFDKVIGAPLPKVPVEVGLLPHWLVIDGVQPDIPENAAVDALKHRSKRPRLGTPSSRSSAQEAAVKGAAKTGKTDAPSERDGAAAPAPAEATTVRAPVKHVLSQELQLYLDRVSTVLKSTHDLEHSGPQTAAVVAVGTTAGGAIPPPVPTPGQLLRAVLQSLSSDPGFQPVVPYLVQSIGEGVATGLRDIPRLQRLLSAVRALTANPALDLVPYLHQLLPAVLTCLVSKRLGDGRDPGHWAVRDSAAAVAHDLCAKYGDPLHNLQPRIARTLVKAFQDASKPLTSHYGAVVGLAALGKLSVWQLLIPNLQQYLKTLLPLLERDQEPASQRSSQAIAAAAIKHEEALKVFAALRSAVAAALMTDDDNRLPGGKSIDDVSLSQLRLQRPNNKTSIKANPPALQLLPQPTLASHVDVPPTLDSHVNADGKDGKRHGTDAPSPADTADRPGSSPKAQHDADEALQDDSSAGRLPAKGRSIPNDAGSDSTQQHTVSAGESEAGRQVTKVAADSFGDGMQPYLPLTGASKTFI